MKELAKTYNPKDFENRLYDFWMENKYFHAEVDENKKPFTITMPPPNVTGNLHLGHAMYVLQDILIRWKRMDGYSALWVPGTDHASISTEARVVNKIRNEGKTKEELGREKFLEEAWDWTEKYGGNIKNQLMKMGFSCDWDRERFTLDHDLSDAVLDVFVKLYEKGYIYRGDRIINWCPDCKTSISDAEVDHEETHSKIWYFKYPLVDGDGFVTIATTRPETILGDLAVAVNPADERYTDLVGKKVMLPLMNREIPIIADDYVEMDFGTGVVKITPSHDPNDFEVGARHNLGQLVILDEEAKINENGGDYCGLDRYEARKKIIEDFKDLGLFVKEEVRENSVGHCERCNTVVEPIISKQWFVKMKEMAEATLKEFKENNSPEFVPSRFSKIYEQWLENIRDWNISRQLWWGHRLPVYYINGKDEYVVSKTKPEDTDEIKYVQDEDTLDTWFSSALWPFSVLGWPKETEDFKYFYPTDVLITGYDIIFFWVIRMVFSAIEHTGQVPFKHVLITGIVRDEQGRKMSKSLDNGVDPLDVIDHYGADALRFFLVNGNSPGNDLRYFESRVEASRNFANKLWNASRLVLMNVDDNFREKSIEDINLKSEDKWILHKLNQTIVSIDKQLDKFEIGLYSNEIYEFIWYEFCDWYLEMVKYRLYDEDVDVKNDAVNVLMYLLDKILKLLHPIMPFITEEIYQHLPVKDEALIIASWPKYQEAFEFKETYDEIEFTKEIIKSIRNIRAEMNLPNKKKTNMLYYTEDKFEKAAIENNSQQILTLANCQTVKFEDKANIDPDEHSVLLVGKAEVFLPLKELIDREKEIERLTKEKEKAISEIERVNSKLANQGFVSKAPEKLINEERAKKETYETMLKNINLQLEKLNK
ncbi:valine--tRNA ligase [Neofamilia massiliensis]|uniref:valine--tRNA ligase n=1 Tax=Neofamilia massiliensis TaxID=1673724 RepID=UPI0006BB546B|nr:valine--tRNA ligase [Neofamilia massiliensis]